MRSSTVCCPDLTSPPVSVHVSTCVVSPGSGAIGVNSSSCTRTRACLALHHGPELRSREAGVEEQHVHAELGQRAGDVEEVAVVSAQHADGVAAAYAEAAEAACQRVGPVVELGECQLPAFVDQRKSRVVTGRADCEDGSQARSPVADGRRDTQHPAGRLRVEHARAREHCGRVRGLGQPFERTHHLMLGARNVLEFRDRLPVPVRRK